MTKNAPYFTTLCWSLLHRNNKSPSHASIQFRFSLFSNIVGYQEITIPGNATGTEYSMFTVTFKKVGGGGIPINQIQVLDASGNPIASCVNAITLQKISGAACKVNDETTYSYNTARNLGWHAALEATTKLPDSIVLHDGEGVLVSNTLKADAKFRVSGEVEISPMSFPLSYVAGGTGYSIFGNNTPVPVKINAIKVLDASKNPIATCVNAITLQKISGAACKVKDETTYSYNTARGLGWHAALEATTKLPDTITLAPGEAAIVCNSLGAEAYLQLPAPIQ